MASNVKRFVRGFFHREDESSIRRWIRGQKEERARVAKERSFLYVHIPNGGHWSEYSPVKQEGNEFLNTTLIAQGLMVSIGAFFPEKGNR